MIFPYWDELRGREVRSHPLIPLTVHGRAGSIQLLALVDSGAEHNVLNAEFATELGIALESADPVTIFGAGEQAIPGRLSQLELQLGRYRWTAPVIFAQRPMRRPILGQIGFFAFFTVSFRYKKGEMDIRRTF